MLLKLMYEIMFFICKIEKVFGDLHAKKRKKNTKKHSTTSEKKLKW